MGHRFPATSSAFVLPLFGVMFHVQFLSKDLDLFAQLSFLLSLCCGWFQCFENWWVFYRMSKPWFDTFEVAKQHHIPYRNKLHLFHTYFFDVDSCRWTLSCFITTSTSVLELEAKLHYGVEGVVGWNENYVSSTFVAMSHFTVRFTKLKMPFEIQSVFSCVFTKVEEPKSFELFSFFRIEDWFC